MATPSSVLSMSSKDSVLDVLRGADKLILVTHENPDGDALGSLVAMHELLTALGKDSLMFIARGEFPLPYEYRFLPLEGHVSEAPDDLEEREVVFLDCGNVDRNPAAEVLLQGSGRRTVNIDHHHDNTNFADINHVDPSASCTAEIVWGSAPRTGHRADPVDRGGAVCRPDHRHRLLHVREHGPAGPPDGGRADRGGRGSPCDVSADL